MRLDQIIDATSTSFLSKKFQFFLVYMLDLTDRVSVSFQVQIPYQIIISYHNTLYANNAEP